MKTLRVCVVTPSGIGVTETFIRAHLERLPYTVIHLCGHELDYSNDEQSLSEWHRQTFPSKGRWLNLLPRYIEFRLRRAHYPEPEQAEIARDFLLAERVDVVLAEYGPAGAAVAPICQMAGVPLVVHFHGIDASHSATLLRHAEAYRAMFEYASAVVSVSRAMTEQLEALGCSGRKIQLNPYGPDPVFFEVTPDYACRTLLAVGRQTFKKAPYLTLDAFRLALDSCPDLRLCMIGGGDLLEISQQLARAWGIDDRVDFLGFASRDAIIRKMSCAFAFVQHSIQASSGDSEGMPVAILEAAAAGLPVVSTRHAGIPDAVIDGETGFVVEPGDSGQMAERIVALAQNRQLAEKFGSAGRKHVSTHYLMERHIAELSRILARAKNGTA